MRRGTTTMKMISSTSTTSTSGVTFISDCSSTSDPPWICVSSVSPRLFLVCALGDQPQPVEAGPLDRDHGLPHLAEAKPRVAPEHHLAVGLRVRRNAETLVE